MYNSARQYAVEGYETNKLLTDLLRHTDQKSHILVVTDPGIQWEWNSLNNFLTVKKRSCYVLAPQKTLIENSFDSAWTYNLWESLFVNKQFSDMKKPADVIIFLDSGLVNKIKKDVLDLSSYKNLYDSSFRFALLIKKVELRNGTQPGDKS